MIVTADDGTTPTDYQFTWTFNAMPPNNSPNPATVANQNNLDGDAVVPVDASTSDPDGDTPTYSLAGQPAGLSIDTNSGIVSGTLASNASQGGVSGVHTVTVTADDGLSTPTNYQFTWTVTDPAPLAGSVANQNSQDGDVVVSLDASTSDPDNDTLSYSLGDQPAGLSINSTSGIISGTIDSNASQGGVGGV